MAQATVPILDSTFFHINSCGRIDAVDLKHVLGDIQTDCGKSACGRLPDVVCSNDHLTAIRRRERAPSTTSIAETTNTAD
jgi:hypothetical protein